MLPTPLGVNMPGLSVDLPAMSVKDKEDIKWGIKNDVGLCLHTTHHQKLIPFHYLICFLTFHTDYSQ